jgi:hypothetical protein
MVSNFSKGAKTSGPSSSHCIHASDFCLKKGVKEIAIGDLNGIRENMDYGDSVN